MKTHSDWFKDLKGTKLFLCLNLDFFIRLFLATSKSAGDGSSNQICLSLSKEFASITAVVIVINRGGKIEI